MTKRVPPTKPGPPRSTGDWAAIAHTTGVFEGPLVEAPDPGAHESQFPDAFPTGTFPSGAAISGQDPHALGGARDNILEVAIGREVRAFRNKLGITVSDLAAATGLSLGMLSSSRRRCSPICTKAWRISSTRPLARA